MQEAFAILLREVRGNTPATKERSLCCQLGSGALQKDSGSNFLHHTAGLRPAKPQAEFAEGHSSVFRTHLVTSSPRQALAEVLQSEAEKKAFLVAKESHSLPFQNKHYLWPCGVEGRPPEPGAPTCQDLQHIAFISGSPAGPPGRFYAEELALESH